MSPFCQDGGSRLTQGYIADYSHFFSEKMEKFGRNIMGRTTCPEFGVTVTTESILTGATCNPRDVSRIAGGSGGSMADLMHDDMSVEEWLTDLLALLPVTPLSNLTGTPAISLPLGKFPNGMPCTWAERQVGDNALREICVSELFIVMQSNANEATGAIPNGRQCDMPCRFVKADDCNPKLRDGSLFYRRDRANLTGNTSLAIRAAVFALAT